MSSTAKDLDAERAAARFRSIAKALVEAAGTPEPTPEPEMAPGQDPVAMIQMLEGILRYDFLKRTGSRSLMFECTRSVENNQNYQSPPGTLTRALTFGWFYALYRHRHPVEGLGLGLEIFQIDALFRDGGRVTIANWTEQKKGVWAWTFAPGPWWMAMLEQLEKLSTRMLQLHAEQHANNAKRRLETREQMRRREELFLLQQKDQDGGTDK